MNNHKKEKRNTMILFVLIFIGINYGIATFLIEPQLMALESAKESYRRGGENQSILEALTIDRQALEEEIASLTLDFQGFDKLVSKKIDTLQLGYDFYTFTKEQDVEGGELVYDLSALYEYDESQNQASMDIEAIIEENGYTYNEEGDLVDGIGNLIVLEDPTAELERTYVRGNIKVQMRMLEAQLPNVLTTIDSITKQKLYPEKVVLNAVREEVSQVDGEGTERVSDQNYMELEVDYVSFVDTTSDFAYMLEKYDFYKYQEPHETLPELFDASVQLNGMNGQ